MNGLASSTKTARVARIVADGRWVGSVGVCEMMENNATVQHWSLCGGPLWGGYALPTCPGVLHRFKNLLPGVNDWKEGIWPLLHAHNTHLGEGMTLRSSSSKVVLNDTSVLLAIQVKAQQASLPPGPLKAAWNAPYL
jgi:hypothetical protein